MADGKDKEKVPVTEVLEEDDEFEVCEGWGDKRRGDGEKEMQIAGETVVRAFLLLRMTEKGS